MFEGCKCAASEKAAGVDNRDAVGEQLYLGQSVRREEQRGIPAAEDFGLQEVAKLEEAAIASKLRVGSSKRKNAWFVEQRAGEAEALHRAGRERAHLAIEAFFQMELLREIRDALRGGSRREMIEAAKEAQVFTASQPGIETDVAAGVIAELAANGTRIENGIVPRDLHASAGGQQQRGENAEECGFSCAICAEQRQGFARTHFERNSGESGDGGLLERLQKRAPAAASGRKRLQKGVDKDGGRQALQNL